MRITNKIIQNNSLNNININKTLQDTLSTQIATEKKISRPSDDPIVALRSLRLRTSVNQVSQYVDKNVEDGKSWLTVTEDAIDTLSDIITDIRKNYTKGTSDPLTVSDRTVILENLESLAAEIYNTGNVDFAGRSVFTGYRTESTLTFQQEENIDYKITEDSSTLTVDETTYVHLADTANGEDETNVATYSITRIRLSYNECDDKNGTVTLNFKVNGTAATPTVTKVDLNSNPYEYCINNPGEVVYVPETGELLVGANVATSADDISEVKVTYEKSAWNKGDLKPEHYFNCESTENGKTIVYDSHGGEIQYNVGTNQKLRINTTADECFSHNIVRDLEDVVYAIKEVDSIEKTISDLEAQIKEVGATDTTKAQALNDQLDAAKKAQTFLNEKLHTLFSESITNADEYLDANDVALTNCGTRSKRLELIENRLDTQLDTLKELKSENEDVDLADAAIRMSSASTAYSAALLATSKTLKESLLNYI